MGKLLIGLIFILAFTNVLAKTASQAVNPVTEVNYFHRLTGLNKQTLKDAFAAYNCASLQGDQPHKAILTIVDFKLPSYRKRLWVLDLKAKKVLFWTYVSHGTGSGKTYPTRFSNQPNSFASSLGLYETGQSYYGQWGYAMRLHGLEQGINNNAYARAIVVHAGHYVGEEALKKYGRIGESHGCLVVPAKYERGIVNTLRDGSLIFAYYPQAQWLKKSPFLHCSANTNNKYT